MVLHYQSHSATLLINNAVEFGPDASLVCLFHFDDCVNIKIKVCTAKYGGYITFIRKLCICMNSKLIRSGCLFDVT